MMPEQYEEAGRQDRRYDEDEVEDRDRRPYLDEALEDKVGPAAEIALHRAGRDTDHGRRRGQDQPEQYRDAEAVDDAGGDVARLVVCAEPVPVAERAVGIVDPVEIAVAALFLGIHPGRRGGRGRRDLVVDRAVGIADRRPDHPAVLLDLLLDEGIAVVRHGEEAPELLLRIIDHDGEKDLSLIGGDERPVVGDEFRKHRQHEEDQKYPQRPVAAPVGLEVLPAALVERRQPGPRRPLAHLLDLRLAEDVRHQTSLRSKSMRGSIQVYMRSDRRLTRSPISEKM
jgi:hypothetical protein